MITITDKTPKAPTEIINGTSVEQNHSYIIIYIIRIKQIISIVEMPFGVTLDNYNSTGKTKNFVTLASIMFVF